MKHPKLIDYLAGRPRMPPVDPCDEDADLDGRRHIIESSLFANLVVYVSPGLFPIGQLCHRPDPPYTLAVLDQSHDN